MILKSFIPGNLVSLCMKIINSAVVVGLYYGFLTTFSIGPSYLFLLRARVMEEGEEGTEKKVSATTGFIAGQLMMFISIYYAPLHLALGRPHTITVLALPYLLFHFFWNNNKHFFDYGSTTRNSMRNLSIQCVFLNNLIFQLFNHFILPSSMLARLVNIYMFRCNNKMLFVTSSFVGWLIGHLLFMKWVGLVLVWIQQNNSIRSNVLIRSNKYLVSELRNSMARVFSILLFITCVYSLGRIPSPILTKKLKGTLEREERRESEEERDMEIETISEMGGTKEEQEVSTEEDPSPSPFSEEREDPDKIDETEEIRVNGKEKKKTKDKLYFHFKETYYKNSPFYETSYLDGNQENSKLKIEIEKKDKYLLWFDKPLVTLLFDYKKWNRPLRYIKNSRFQNPVKNEMSQYFFYTCQSDGKERISFTYPPSLSTFGEMMQKKVLFFTTGKFLSDQLYNDWSSSNEIKRKSLSNEFKNRIEALDKEFFILDILEKRTRVCNDQTKKKNLPKIYDPLLHGFHRGRIKKRFSHSSINKSYIKKNTRAFCINKIHAILLLNDYQEFEQTIDILNGKGLSTEKELSLLPEQVKLDSDNEIKISKSLLNLVITDPKDQKSRKRPIGIKEISKTVPRWSYKLITDWEQLRRKTEESLPREHQIRTRKAKRVVIFTDKQLNTDPYTNNNIDEDINNIDERGEVALTRYSQQPDFRRNIIKGSMRAQRRKMVIWKLFQANVHSPLFLDRIDNAALFSFDISESMKLLFLNLMGKNKESKIYNYKYKEKEREENRIEKEEEGKKEKYKREEKMRIKIAEAWDRIILAQIIRGSVLVTQAILRKYIILPSLIIAKNIARILLFQIPEWSEDFKDWNREIYIKCTYNGVQLSETEFPKNWLIDGIQIKILFPFCLKPWHRPKLESPHKDSIKKSKSQKNDFCFLTVWGMETEFPFGSPRKKRSFFEPIFNELKRKINEIQIKYFRLLRVLTNLFPKALNETKKWIMKGILFLNKKIKEFSNPILLFGLRKIYEWGETKKHSVIRNQTIQESYIHVQSTEWTKFSLTEKKMKDLTERTSTIRNQIEQIIKEKQNRFRTQEINTSSNKKNYHDKILESSKSIWQTFKRRNTRLIRKLYYFLKFVIEKIYINIFLSIVNIPRINTQLFLESTKKIIEKYIDNNEKDEEKINKANKNTIHFISTIKNSLYNIRNKNSKDFSAPSFLSQAYVFYKISKTKVINLYKFKSIFRYHGTSLFLKNEIRDSFGKQGIFYYELGHKTFCHSEMNHWKTWLRNHYQYDLSQIQWLRLVPEKWRNRVTKHYIAQNKDFKKWDSYEKERSVHYQKQKKFRADSLLNQNYRKSKSKVQKYYSYNFLSYKSINYEDKRDSYIYGSPLQRKNKEGIPSNYKIDKDKIFDILGGIHNYLDENYIMDLGKISDRKYFDWRILNFSLKNLKNKVNVESWVNTGTNSNKLIKAGFHNYQIIEKINNKSFFDFKTNHNKKRNPVNKRVFLFDWMGMNEKLLSRPISTLGLWFFPEFVLLYNVYKIKPWIIPIKLLLLNCNANGNINKKITENKKGNPFISSNEKNFLGLENRNQEDKELISQGYLVSDEAKQRNLESSLASKEKGVEEDYSSSKIKKGRNKKQYKISTKTELSFFLKRYLRFQLRWDDSLNERLINNIKVYCLLLRLINPKEIAISFIQRGEMSLDIMMIQRDLTITELMKKGILIIEPTRLSVKNNGQFILYQTISISLVHKNKDEINQGYKKKYYVDKNNFDEYIARHQRMAGNRDKSYYDLFVPEKILSPKRRRELRIRISLNSNNGNDIHKNTIFCNNVKNCGQVLNKNKHFGGDKNQLIKLKFFLWPNYRLEDLACMNRYWFNTNNGSSFSLLRIHMYPRVKIR
uniref:Translocon at the inner envelope membrane of chloroplasts 214 n=1 Tax=Grielum grandiflorum TaxID=2806825 RepID=A0A8E8PD78_9ROSI|nr:hypothetical protein RF1 [Grielum grandiflorum]